MFGKGGNGQGIVSMTEREKARREASLRQVEAYWKGLCDGVSVPLRSQIDPRGIEQSLENAFLIERIAPTMAKIRVAGSHLNDLMGMQVGGMPLSSIITPADREKFGEGVAALFAEPAIIRMELKAESGFGKPDISASLILLPLRSDFGDLTRGLGVLITHGRIGRTPRRFKVSELQITKALSGDAGITARTPIKLTDDAPVRSFGERPAAFTPKTVEGDASTPTLSAPERGHLKLVVDNG
ncbi:PAS domain-containing protein [Sagittula sp. SSi028]|uniref:PAS domain-containing protein n=1 Tax=Sagittula sp. SSi028 TaxID=3400636 RepID=UPI003AF57650